MTEPEEKQNNGNGAKETEKEESTKEVSTSRRGDTIESTRVLIRAALAGGTLIGFFSMLIYLIRILPYRRDPNIGGEYWLFMGNILGILGTLTVNTLSFYFGSSDTKDGQ